MFDSGRDDENSVLIFSTNRDIEMLCASEFILRNGMFTTIPSQFLQLFTVGPTWNYKQYYISQGLLL